MQRPITLIFILILIPSLSFSQYLWDYGGGLGAANYLGEMGGLAETRNDYVKDLKWESTRPSVTGFARYKMMQQISIKTSLNWMRISGADSLSTNPGRAGRNLSFRNDIFELALEAQYFVYTINDLGNTYRYKNDFRLYISAGAAGFFHNPKAKLGDVWYNLRPYQTEGIHYSPFGFSVPLGIGFYFTKDKKYRFGWELIWRTAFTDYLDDASTVYVDPAFFNGDAIAMQLANRRGEVSNPDIIYPKKENYDKGQKRGDPTHNDSYISSNIYFTYVLRGKSSFYRSKYGNLFGGSKYKRRRIRAKF